MNLLIKPGCGYWDVTRHGYGGSFHRANSAGLVLDDATPYTFYADGSVKEFQGTAFSGSTKIIVASCHTEVVVLPGSAALNVTVEHDVIDSDLASCTFHLKGAPTQHRETAAVIIKNHGYKAHVGGRHVAALCPTTGKRLLLVTGPKHEPDWN